MRLSRGTLALWAAAFCGVQVGAATAASRAIVPVFGPGPLAALRYAVAVAILLPFYLRARSARFGTRDFAAVALLGVFQFGVLIALLNVGLLTVPASRAATLFATSPLMTMGLAAAIGQERLTAPKLAGVALTVAGVALALGGGGEGGDAAGAAAVLAAAAVGAGCSVLYRPYLARHPSFDVGFVAMAAALVALTPWAALEGFRPVWTEATAADWALVGFVGLSSGVGFTIWLWALKHATPTRVTVFQALGPVTAALLGALTLGEAVGLATAGGVAAVAGGLWLTTRPDPARA